jgi:hypothetical protein
MRIHVGKLTESESGLKGFTAKHALISNPGRRVSKSRLLSAVLPSQPKMNIAALWG